MADLRSVRALALAHHDKVMDAAWIELNTMPSNTNAVGGADIHTVALQLFNSCLNRDLEERVTAKEAREANRRSFG